MSRDFLIGLDLGTQSIRALLADARGTTLACARRPTPTNRINGQSAEYDADALWTCVLDLLKELAPQVPAGDTVAGIACASIGESCVLVDAAGIALAPALAWFDRRTEADGRAVEAALGADRLFRITGYPPDPTLSLPKILWYRRERPDAFARARWVLPMSPWIAFRLCGIPAIDPSLASRTLCLDAHARTWSTELLSALDLDVSFLPPILSPAAPPSAPCVPKCSPQPGCPGILSWPSAPRTTSAAASSPERRVLASFSTASARPRRCWRPPNLRP